MTDHPIFTPEHQRSLQIKHPPFFGQRKATGLFPKSGRERTAGRMSSTTQGIIQGICNAHDVTFMEIVGDSRMSKIVRARQEAMWRLAQLTIPNGKAQFSADRIGMIFGARDASTVRASIRMYAKRTCPAA